MTVAQSPALTVVKSVTSTGPYNTVGQTVTYQFVAKNTGNVTLTTVGINDTQTAPAGALTSGPTCTGLTTPTATCSGSSTTLLPGQSATFTATYTLTQADLNNGSVADSATASGTPPTGSPITSAPSTATVTIAQAPTLTVTKTSTTADVQSVGQVVPYTFVAKNTGNVTLTGVGITDTQTAPSLNTSLSAITCQSLATPTATCSGSTTTLLPGQSATFAANYTVTAADLTHGSVADSATATGTPPIGSPVTSPPATLSLPAATLTVAKSVTSTGPYNTVGQTVTYKFVATNTGTTSLTGVSITDTQTAPSLNTSLSAITCQSLATPTATCSGTSTTLAAGQSATFTATYTLTQADLDHGSVADSATATGTPPSGTPITSSPSTATVTATQTPALTVVKSVTSTGPYNTVGQTVTYQFVAKNTGNVTLTTVGINDTQTAPAGALTSGPTCTGLTTPTATCSGSSTTLAPGQSATFTATYTLTQADLNNGSVNDSATATGTPPTGSPITSSPSTASVTVAQSPALTVVKSVTSTGPYNTVGQTVTYQFVAKNTGNVTLTTVGINDTQTAPAGALTSGPTCTGLTTPTATCSGSSTTLLPGQSATFTATYTLTQADLNNGSVADSATASGTPPTGSPITSAPSTATVTIAQAPTLTVTKTSTTADVQSVGQVVPYTFVAKNTGNVTLTGVGITDTQTAPSLNTSLSAITCQSLATPTATCSGSTTTLLPGQSATFAANYTVTAADLTHGSVADSATATGTPPIGSPVTSPPATLSLPAATLTVAKSVTSTGPYNTVGQTVTYKFVATNTGTTSLTGVSITDTQTAPSLNTSLSAITCQSLATPTATCSGTSTTLAAGQSATFTATYTLTQADLDHGSVADSATSTGTPPSGTPITSSPSTATVTATQTPALTVVKSVTSTGPYNTVGQTVTYQFVAKNTGNVTLTTVGINDTQTAPAGALTSGPTCTGLTTPTATCSGSSTTLAPGQSATFTATYTLTQADLNNGSVNDSATATGTPPTGSPITSSPSTASVTVAQSPALTVVKSVTSTGPYNTVGQTVAYQFVATNTGNVTLTGVGVADTQTAPAGSLTSGPTCTGLATPTATCSGSSTTLLPGQSATFTATYTLTQADLNNGSVADSATASGTPPTGSPITSAPSTATVTIAQAPTLTVTKTSTTADVQSVGQVVPYTFVATNTGNVTLTGVGITDTQTAPSLNTSLSAITCQSLATPTATCSGSTTTLLPGQSATFAANYTVTAADLTHGSVADSATATGTPPTGSPVTSPPATLSLPAATLTVAKSVTSTGPYNTVGQTVTYKFVATNTGTTSLTGVSITDTQTAPSLNTSLSAITCQSLATPTATCSGTSTTLAAGQSATFTATYTLTQADLDHGSVADSATATGTPPSGTPITSSPSTATVTATQTPALTVVKSVTSTGPYNTVGQTVTYQFVATNTGNVTLTTVGINDTQTAPAGALTSGPTCTGLTTPTATCTGSSTTLAPGQSATFTATYTLTQADLNNGSVNDSATATGTPPTGSPITSSPSTASVTVTQSPAPDGGQDDHLHQPLQHPRPGHPLHHRRHQHRQRHPHRRQRHRHPDRPGREPRLRPHLHRPGHPDGLLLGLDHHLGPRTVGHLRRHLPPTCSATHTVTQADLDATGVIQTSATGTGTPPTGPPVTTTSPPVIVPSSPSPRPSPWSSRSPPPAPTTPSARPSPTSSWPRTPAT